MAEGERGGCSAAVAAPVLLSQLHHIDVSARPGSQPGGQRDWHNLHRIGYER